MVQLTAEMLDKEYAPRRFVSLFYIISIALYIINVTVGQSTFLNFKKGYDGRPTSLSASSSA